MAEILDRIRIGERVGHYETTRRRKDGATIEISLTVSPVHDAAGGIVGASSIAHVITESDRRRDFTEPDQAREFSETKAFLDNILQSSTKYSIIGMDLDHHILSWNKGASRNYGYAAQEVVGKDSNILHTPQDVESGAVNRLRTAAYEDGLAEGTFERVRKDGSRFTASVVVTRRDDTLGHPVGFLVMSHDISEKQLAEEKLRSTAMYSRSLIEASLDPLVTISPEGKITDVNEAAIRVTGVDAGAVGRHRLLGLLHRAGPGPRGLPPGIRAGLRHRLPADHQAHRRRLDRRALQRLGVQRRRPATCSAPSPPPATSPPRGEPRAK